MSTPAASTRSREWSTSLDNCLALAVESSIACTETRKDSATPAETAGAPVGLGGTKASPDGLVSPAAKPASATLSVRTADFIHRAEDVTNCGVTWIAVAGLSALISGAFAETTVLIVAPTQSAPASRALEPCDRRSSPMGWASESVTSPFTPGTVKSRAFNDVSSRLASRAKARISSSVGGSPAVMTWVSDPRRTIRILLASSLTSRPARLCRIGPSPKTLPNSLPNDSPGLSPPLEGASVWPVAFGEVAPMVLVRSHELIEQPLPHK